MNETMTAVELGELLGISRRAVTDGEAGHIVAIAPGKYDVAAPAVKEPLDRTCAMYLVSPPSSRMSVIAAAPIERLSIARRRRGRGCVRESENVVMMRIAFLGLLLITGFYLMTGIVYEEGGFGMQLVVKPRPSLTMLVGGGEDGIWQREHPNKPKPWW